MENPPQGMRTCPTPTNGRNVLFAHTIDASECHARQRRLYHKCFTCVYQHGRSSLAPEGSGSNAAAGAAPTPVSRS